jgi:large subunit ribosomal protein L32
MAVPKKRHTKSRRNKRRGNIFLKKPTLISCPKCGKDSLPHTLCLNCGFYKGREVIDVFKKMNKKEKKDKEKEIKEGQEKPLSMTELSKKE